MCSRNAPVPFLAALLLAALALGACGKKGDPLPPVRYIPLTTGDLQVRQQGRSILLDMAYPNTTVSGLSLGGIDAVELLQLVKPVAAGAAGEGEAAPPLPSAEAREIEAGGRTLLTLRGSELAAAVVGDRIQFRIPLAAELPAAPMANIFAVRTIKADEISAISNRVTLVPIAPPPAPGNLGLEAFADGIEVSWEAAAETLGFDLFRREASLRGYGQPIRRVAGDARSYRDREARYGKRYIYTLRAVASAKPLIHSEAAGEREIDYRDTFAPPLPPNLVALAERASVRLRWDPSGADDVAGYVVYRREPGRDFHRLGEDLITGTELLDRNLTSGFTYAYRIQVVDEKGNESPLSAPVETTAR